MSSTGYFSHHKINFISTLSTLQSLHQTLVNGCRMYTLLLFYCNVFRRGSRRMLFHLSHSTIQKDIIHKGMQFYLNTVLLLGHNSYIFWIICRNIFITHTLCTQKLLDQCINFFNKTHNFLKWYSNTSHLHTLCIHFQFCYNMYFIHTPHIMRFQGLKTLLRCILCIFLILNQTFLHLRSAYIRQSLYQQMGLQEDKKSDCIWWRVQTFEAYNPQYLGLRKTNFLFAGCLFSDFSLCPPSQLRLLQQREKVLYNNQSQQSSLRQQHSSTIDQFLKVILRVLDSFLINIILMLISCLSDQKKLSQVFGSFILSFRE